MNEKLYDAKVVYLLDIIKSTIRSMRSMKGSMKFAKERLKEPLKDYYDLIFSLMFTVMMLCSTYQAVMANTFHYYDAASSYAKIGIFSGVIAVVEIIWFDFNHVFGGRKTIE